MISRNMKIHRAINKETSGSDFFAIGDANEVEVETRMVSVQSCNVQEERNRNCRTKVLEIGVA